MLGRYGSMRQGLQIAIIASLQTRDSGGHVVPSDPSLAGEVSTQMRERLVNSLIRKLINLRFIGRHPLGAPIRLLCLASTARRRGFGDRQRSRDRSALGVGIKMKQRHHYWSRENKRGCGGLNSVYVRIDHRLVALEFDDVAMGRVFIDQGGEVASNQNRSHRRVRRGITWMRWQAHRIDAGEELFLNFLPQLLSQRCGSRRAAGSAKRIAPFCDQQRAFKVGMRHGMKFIYQHHRRPLRHLERVSIPAVDAIPAASDGW